ncbi:phosphatidate cytidylyltransferase [Sphingomonas colocasiae]|uniref:Phosphatidate cytidylyltransferase n=1 Tax=Sphingomonas colocasiae TaxID=1848973 RepID=A0ABS7PJ94_9SPHN|nr:phosphatidate cytidylyltransferase [Sphingomonas colocasiae]MBY8821364.1 phosphatidate cytidylyltransferase [Sphingomonas colocasiae]
MTAPEPASEPGPEPRKPSDLPRRAVVGIILIAVAVAALYAGGTIFWILISVASLLMLSEWADLAGAGQSQKRIAMFSASIPLAIISPLAAGPGFFAVGLIAAATFFTGIVTQRTQLAAGVVYVSLPAMALLFIRGQDSGLILAFWTLAIVWATDIGAYFAGRSIGGPKLMPAVSPSKTWSGLAGGMIAAVFTGLAFAHWGGIPLGLALASLVLAVVAQGGDLFESALKRRAGVKDSGTLLPGHGGVLDRLDGLVPVAPMVALLILADGML